MIHWKLIIKRFIRRFRYVFIWKDVSTWKYESCERCGHCFRICWQTKDDKWIAIYGNDSGCLCIDCFIELAADKGIEIKAEDIHLELFNPE